MEMAAVFVVAIAGLGFARSRVTSQGTRDVLGISLTFVVLFGVMMLMIVAEYLLG